MQGNEFWVADEKQTMDINNKLNYFYQIIQLAAPRSL